MYSKQLRTPNGIAESSCNETPKNPDDWMSTKIEHVGGGLKAQVTCSKAHNVFKMMLPGITEGIPMTAMRVRSKVLIS
jgi:hypothetical protein